MIGNDGDSSRVVMLEGQGGGNLLYFLFLAEWIEKGRGGFVVFFSEKYSLVWSLVGRLPWGACASLFLNVVCSVWAFFFLFLSFSLLFLFLFLE